MSLYRIVKNYGYGDIHWYARMFTENEVMKWLEGDGLDLEDRTFDSIYSCGIGLYEIEIDHPDDIPPSDWMDS